MSKIRNHISYVLMYADLRERRECVKAIRTYICFETFSFFKEG